MIHRFRDARHRRRDHARGGTPGEDQGAADLVGRVVLRQRVGAKRRQMTSSAQPAVRRPGISTHLPPQHGERADM